MPPDRSDDTQRFYQEFGKRLHDARIDKGLSQEALGAAIGLNRTSVSNIEKGRQRLLIHQLPSLGRILGVEIDELLPSGSDVDVLKGLTGNDRDAVAAVLRASEYLGAS